MPHRNTKEDRILIRSFLRRGYIYYARLELFPILTTIYCRMDIHGNITEQYTPFTILNT